MKVRIVNRPTGLLNGRDWPDAGEVLEVEDHHGADMCAAGIGVPVVDDGVETAVLPGGERRDVPKGNASREEWAAYAASKGAPEEETKPVEDGGLKQTELREKYAASATQDSDTSAGSGGVSAPDKE